MAAPGASGASQDDGFAEAIVEVHMALAEGRVDAALAAWRRCGGGAHRQSSARARASRALAGRATPPSGGGSGAHAHDAEMDARQEVLQHLEGKVVDAITKQLGRLAQPLADAARAAVSSGTAGGAAADEEELAAEVGAHTHDALALWEQGCSLDAAAATRVTQAVAACVGRALDAQAGAIVDTLLESLAMSGALRPCDPRPPERDGRGDAPRSATSAHAAADKSAHARASGSAPAPPAPIAAPTSARGRLEGGALAAPQLPGLPGLPSLPGLPGLPGLSVAAAAPVFDAPAATSASIEAEATRTQPVAAQAAPVVSLPGLPTLPGAGGVHSNATATMGGQGTGVVAPGSHTGDRDGSGNGGGVGSDEPASPAPQEGTSPSEAGDASGDEAGRRVGALTSVLNVAGHWIAVVDGTQSPVRQRCAAIAALHERTVRHAVPLAVGIAAALRVDALAATLADVGAHDYGGGAEANTAQAAAKAAESGLDGVLDALAFTCQVIEQYLRFVAGALQLRGSAELRCALTEQVQLLVSRYVVLEHAYSSRNVETALEVAEPQEVEAGAWSLSLADDAPFVLSTSAARASLTLSELAVVATLNNVASLLDGPLRAALRRLVPACGFAATGGGGVGELESVAASLASGPRSGGGSGPKSGGALLDATEADREAAVDALSAAFAAAMAGGGAGGAPLSASGPGSGHGELSSGPPSSGAASAGEAVPAATALNTIVGAAVAAANLEARVRSGIAEAFPEVAVAAGEEGEDAAAARRGDGPPAFARLEASLAELSSVAASLQAVSDEAVATFGAALAGDGPATLASDVARARYTLTAAELEALTTADPFADNLTEHVLHGDGVAAALAELTGAAAAAVLLWLARDVATRLERAWASCGAFNECGGLCMAAQLRQAMDGLAALARDDSAPAGGASSLRSLWSRLQHTAFLLCAPRAADVLARPYPRPALSEEEVREVLARREDYRAG